MCRCARRVSRRRLFTWLSFALLSRRPLDRVASASGTHGGSTDARDRPNDAPVHPPRVARKHRGHRGPARPHRHRATSTSPVSTWSADLSSRPAASACCRDHRRTDETASSRPRAIPEVAHFEAERDRRHARSRVGHRPEPLDGRDPRFAQQPHASSTTSGQQAWHGYVNQPAAGAIRLADSACDVRDRRRHRRDHRHRRRSESPAAAGRRSCPATTSSTTRPAPASEWTDLDHSTVEILDHSTVEILDATSPRCR